MRDWWASVHLGLQMKWEDFCICANIVVVVLWAVASWCKGFGQWRHYTFFFLWLDGRWHFWSVMGKFLLNLHLGMPGYWWMIFYPTFFEPLKLVIFGGVGGGRPPRMGCAPAPGSSKINLPPALLWAMSYTAPLALCTCWQLNCRGIYSFFRLPEWVLASCWDSNPIIPTTRTVSGFITG